LYCQPEIFFGSMRKGRKAQAIAEVFKRRSCFFLDGTTGNLVYFDSLGDDEGYVFVARGEALLPGFLVAGGLSVSASVAEAVSVAAQYREAAAGYAGAGHHGNGQRRDPQRVAERSPCAGGEGVSAIADDTGPLVSDHGWWRLSERLACLPAALRLAQAGRRRFDFRDSAVGEALSGERSRGRDRGRRDGSPGGRILWRIK